MPRSLPLHPLLYRLRRLRLFALLPLLLVFPPLAAAADAAPAANATPAEDPDEIPAPAAIALLTAIDQNDMNTLRGLIADTPALVHQKIKDHTLLSYAIRSGNLPAFHFLLRSGADINQRNAQGRTPLMDSVLMMRPLFLRELLQHPAIDIAARDAADMTALDYLTRFASVDALNLRQIYHREESIPDLLAQAEEAKKLFTSYHEDFLISARKALAWFPEPWRPALRHRIAGQEVWRYAFAAAALLTALLLNRLLRALLDFLGARSLREAADAEHGVLHRSAAALRRGGRWGILGAGLYLTAAMAAPGLMVQLPWLPDALASITLALLAYDAIEVLDYCLIRWLQRADFRIDDTLIPLLRRALRAVVVLAAGLHLYKSLTGNEITTVLAGLGIGGMAVALAATDTLKNFIGFLMILLDRPFVVGERIVVDRYDGVVEYIGLRTTRLRCPDSTQVSIPNAKAVDSIILNIGRRRGQKRAFRLALSPAASLEELQQALTLLRALTDELLPAPQALPAQVYFSDRQPDGLFIDITYWHPGGDEAEAAAFHERLYLELLRRLRDAGVPLADK